ncbi:uncharacterized protein J3R85_011562 [Psidium guajava]|nr:uncharacterized protein J3R85_011562 [Psidium guajava]
MVHYPCYKCRPPPPGPLPYPVLLFLALVCLFIALSKLLSFDSLFEAPEIRINWPLLLVPVAILALVQWISGMEKRRKFYPPAPCCRCWKTHQCYCR